MNKQQKDKPLVQSAKERGVQGTSMSPEGNEKNVPTESGPKDPRTWKPQEIRPGGIPFLTTEEDEKNNFSTE